MTTSENYIAKFFELRPAFLADAKAGKVGVNNVKDWLKEHAPDYEDLSWRVGFDSIDEEINFVKELADLLKENGSISGYIRTLRRDTEPSDTVKKNFINALGKAITKLAQDGKFTDKKNLAYATYFGERFSKYDPDAPFFEGGFEYEKGEKSRGPKYQYIL